MRVIETAHPPLKNEREDNKMKIDRRVFIEQTDSVKALFDDINELLEIEMAGHPIEGELYEDNLMDTIDRFAPCYAKLLLESIDSTIDKGTLDFIIMLMATYIQVYSEYPRGKDTEEILDAYHLYLEQLGFGLDDDMSKEQREILNRLWNITHIVEFYDCVKELGQKKCESD